MPGSDIMEPRSSGNVHIGLGIRFLFSIEYSHLSGAHELCGTWSTWLSHFLLGLSSSEMATLKTSHVAPRTGHETPRPSRGGELLRWVPRLQLGLGWTQAIPDVISFLWRSVFSVPSWRSVLVSSSSGASIPLFLVLAFILLRGRASPLRYKGLLAVDVFFFFCEHLSHTCLRVLRDREH